MSEMKQGYPNPDYRKEDVGMELLEMHAEIYIDDKEYRELLGKAVLHDTLKAAILSMGKIDEDVVRALTGTLDDESKAEAEKNWDYYWKEHQTNLELLEKLAATERANDALREILRQNGIGATPEPTKAADNAEVNG